MPFLKKFWPFILLAVLSFTIHLAFLSYPAQVVFDEVHFGKFVAAYSTGQYYFDIHPPLGKLMIAGFAKLAGVNPVFDFAKIGETLPADTLFIMRFLPAFFGALFVLTFAWLAWLISRNKTTSLIAGFLILLDNAFLVQSKFILVDIFLLFFEVLTLCFFFLWQRQKSFGAKWFGYLTLTGIFAGLTISVKWTGLATIGIIGVVLFAKIFSKKLTNYLASSSFGHPERSRSKGSIIDSSALPMFGFIMTKWNILKGGLVSFIIILSIAFLIYLLPFYLHFQFLPNSGTGDAFMSQQFQQELKYGRENVYQPLNFWQKFIELNKIMFAANAELAAQHPFGSKWYGWPINSKPVYYWNQETIINLPGWKANIYFSGNPILWFLSILSILFIIIRLFAKKGRQQIQPMFYILLLGYFANLLPFIFIKRVTFLYHYLPSTVYAVLILSLLLSNLLITNKKSFLTVIISAALGFILFSPLSYGWPLPPQINQTETQLINLFH